MLNKERENTRVLLLQSAKLHMSIELSIDFGSLLVWRLTGRMGLSLEMKME